MEIKKYERGWQFDTYIFEMKDGKKLKVMHGKRAAQETKEHYFTLIDHFGPKNDLLIKFYESLDKKHETAAYVIRNKPTRAWRRIEFDENMNSVEEKYVENTLDGSLYGKWKLETDEDGIKKWVELSIPGISESRKGIVVCVSAPKPVTCPDNELSDPELWGKIVALRKDVFRAIEEYHKNNREPNNAGGNSTSVNGIPSEYYDCER